MSPCVVTCYKGYEHGRKNNLKKNILKNYFNYKVENNKSVSLKVFLVKCFPKMCFLEKSAMKCFFIKHCKLIFKFLKMFIELCQTPKVEGWLGNYFLK